VQGVVLEGLDLGVRAVEVLLLLAVAGQVVVEVLEAGKDGTGAASLVLDLGEPAGGVVVPGRKRPGWQGLVLLAAVVVIAEARPAGGAAAPVVVLPRFGGQLVYATSTSFQWLNSKLAGLR
jgi:hypothetical protein